MLSFASCTFGWSNGLMPSTHPATAVANSAKKKIRPRSAAPSTDMVTVGWPASASALTLASSSSSGVSALRR